jgi:enoyl-CoA hydratase/carnithine racemase
MQKLSTLHDGWAGIDCGRVGGSFERLREELESLYGAGSVHVAVLNDLQDWPAEGVIDAEELRWLQLYGLPTIAPFSGEISGPGFELALSCDIRLCEAAATIRARATSKRLLALLGQEAAVEVLRRRGRLDAVAAFEMGLVSEVSRSVGALGADTARLATVIASRGPIATRLAKEAIWRGLAMPLEQALRFETDLTLLLQTTKDRAEGVQAFLEKRPPRFSGE